MTLISRKKSNFNKLQKCKHIKSIKYVSLALIGLAGSFLSSNATSSDVISDGPLKSIIKEIEKTAPFYATSNNPSTFNTNVNSQIIFISNKSGNTFRNDFEDNEDSIGELIKKTEEGRFKNTLSIEQRTRIISSKDLHKHNSSEDEFLKRMDFSNWLKASSYRANQVKAYEQFLSGYVGAKNVPPMNQLLTTARSWADCGYEPYEVPPRELWTNMVLTLRLFNQLKSQGILPASTEIRSVYRSPQLNACAGGAPTSKHLTNGAIDVWVPEYNDEPWLINPMKDRLCQFWATQGESYNLGLGIYATGAVHLDTQGYRMWGAQYTESYSPCRYVNQ